MQQNTAKQFIIVDAKAKTISATAQEGKLLGPLPNGTRIHICWKIYFSVTSNILFVTSFLLKNQNVRTILRLVFIQKYDARSEGQNYGQICGVARPVHAAGVQ